MSCSNGKCTRRPARNTQATGAAADLASAVDGHRAPDASNRPDDTGWQIGQGKIGRLPRAHLPDRTPHPEALANHGVVRLLVRFPRPPEHMGAQPFGHVTAFDVV